MGEHRCGVVAILGRPNAGKSTLLNQLVGLKLAIVSAKPQTTRTSIQGVLTLPDAQIVFTDTPGIHKSDNAFNQRMMRTVRAALDGPDLLLLVVDTTQPFTEEDAQSVDLVKKAQTPALLLLNKIDLLDRKNVLLELIEKHRSLHDFAEYIPVSAITGEGLDVLRGAITARLPEGPALYPEDHVTDQPERFLAGELIREKILNLTRQEVPHAVAVQVDQWEEKPRLTRVAATIFVERPGQKGIVIGAGGSVLKRVGTEARQEMEAFFGRKFFLELHVKVRPAWRESPEFLNELDWRGMAGVEHD